MKTKYYKPRGTFFCSSFEIKAIKPDGTRTTIVYGIDRKTFKEVRKDFEKYYAKHGWVGIELRRSRPYPF